MKGSIKFDLGLEKGNLRYKIFEGPRIFVRYTLGYIVLRCHLGPEFYGIFVRNERKFVVRVSVIIMYKHWS